MTTGLTCAAFLQPRTLDNTREKEITEVDPDDVEVGLLSRRLPCVLAQRKHASAHTQR